MTANLIGHGLIDYVFVFFMLAYAFLAGITRPHRILYILPACLSCFFFIPVGSNLTADKLVPAIFIVTIFLSKGPNYFSTSKKNANTWVGNMWIMIAVSAIVGSIYTDYYAGFVKSPFISTRLIIQTVSYINLLLLFIIARKEISKPKGKELLLKSFVITTTLLTIYGIYQYFAHQLGLPYRGIVYSASSTGFGGYYDSQDIVFRVNSFANEPKRLTYFLVISLIILLKYRKQIISRLNSLLFYVVVLAHAVVLWLTYATSIYISVSIFIIFLLIYSIFIDFNQSLFKQLFLFLIIGASFYSYQKIYFDQLYEIRVDKQIEKEEVRAEVKGQKFMMNYPEMFVLGIGPGNYNFALSKEYKGKAGLAENGRYLVPFNSGIMTYIYDVGIIGFLLIFYPFILILMNNKVASKNDFSIFVVFLFCTAITLNPGTTLFLFIGAFEGIKLLEK